MVSNSFPATESSVMMVSEEVSAIIQGPRSRDLVWAVLFWIAIYGTKIFLDFFVTWVPA